MTRRGFLRALVVAPAAAPFVLADALAAAPPAMPAAPFASGGLLTIDKAKIERLSWELWKVIRNARRSR